MFGGISLLLHTHLNGPGPAHIGQSIGHLIQIYGVGGLELRAKKTLALKQECCKYRANNIP